jgi:hypothetical protein
MIKPREHAIERVESAACGSGWDCGEACLTGNMKLIATLRRGEETITCRPYKTYDDVPGFADTHRVAHRPPNGATETIAKGNEIEQSHEAAAAVLATLDDSD